MAKENALKEGEFILEMLANDLLELEQLAENTARNFGGDAGGEQLGESDNDYISIDDQPADRPRFATVNDEDTMSFIEENRNKNTIYKTNSDLKIFKEWLASVRETRPLESIPPPELDNLLARFFLAVRKKDGSEYEPDTITAIQNSLDRYLRDKKVVYSIKRDAIFSHSNRVLESKRKSLKAQGKGNKKLKADPLSKEEINQLRQKNLLGNNSPKTLLDTVWLNNGIYFGLRGRQDHTNLLWGDIELRQTSQGREYLEFNERATKTRSGAKVSDCRKVTPKAFAVDDDDCPVRAYKEYAEHRPEDLLKPNDRFYLQPLKKPSGIVWYSRTPLGKTQLGKIMNNLAETGGLEGRKVNHSTRKTFATTLIQAGRPPTEVAHLAGWKNVQTVNEYSVPSLQQQEQTSDIISTVMMPSVETNEPPAVLMSECNELCSKENDDPVAKSSYQSMSFSNKLNTQPCAFLCGANISGGTININIFSGKNSQITNSQEN